MSAATDMHQNPPGFGGEQVPINSNKQESETVQEKNEHQENGFKREGDDTFTDLNQLPAIPPVSTGQGLPFAPVDLPSPGDVWSWRVGKRVNNTGFHRDRFLMPPERLKSKNAPKSFGDKKTLSRYLETNFPEMDLNAFFASFSWDIPALFQPADRVDAASLFEETSKQEEKVEDGENKEGTNSRYSQRKRKQMQHFDPAEERLKQTPRGSNRKKMDKAVTTIPTPQTKQKLSSKRSTRQVEAGLNEQETEIKSAKATGGKRTKKRRGGNVADVEVEDVSIPHIYVSPMNGVLAVSHSPVDINPEEFDSYLNSLEKLLQQPPTEDTGLESSSATLPVVVTSPMREYEWAEARMKLSSLLDKDFSSLFMSNEAAEVASLAAKLRKDPSLSAEEIVRLKLIEEIPSFSEVFQENKGVIEEADRFFSALELNKAKVASLKYEYSELKEKLGKFQTEVDSNSETIRQIDEQIAQLQARRKELTRCIGDKEKERVDLSYGQKMVANSIPNVVKEVQAANSKKPDWEMKKDNALKREAEILDKFAPLKGFYL